MQLTDTTTEGATLAWSEVTAEWLGEHGYKLGASVDAPWVLDDDALTLWFEEDSTTGIENIQGPCGDVLGGDKNASKKLMIDGQLYILRHDGLYNATGARVK